MLGLIFSIVAIVISLVAIAFSIGIYLKSKKEFNLEIESIEYKLGNLDSEIHELTETEHKKEESKEPTPPTLVLGSNDGSHTGLKIDTTGAAPGNSGLSISHVQSRKPKSGTDGKRLNIK